VAWGGGKGRGGGPRTAAQQGLQGPLPMYAAPRPPLHSPCQQAEWTVCRHSYKLSLAFKLPCPDGLPRE